MHAAISEAPNGAKGNSPGRSREPRERRSPGIMAINPSSPVRAYLMHSTPSRPYRAWSCCRPVPRALPWAIPCQPFRLPHSTCDPASLPVWPGPLDTPSRTSRMTSTSGVLEVALAQAHDLKIADSSRAPATEPNPRQGQVRNMYGVPRITPEVALAHAHDLKTAGSDSSPSSRAP